MSQRAENPTWRRRARQIVPVFSRVISYPVQLFLSIRRSMTAASVTLLLIGIITLNIIWGFPWVGMFSTCVSLLFAGFAINRIMHPQLRISFSLPNSARAGQAFSVVAHLENRRRIPAMDLTIQFEKAPAAGWANRRSAIAHWSPSPPQQLSLIRPRERKDLNISMASQRRGIHALPDVIVISMFPFQLFRFTGVFPSQAEIAITPRPLTGEEDVLSRGIMDTLGDWTHRLLSGNALDYTGSREYEVGMPVRSWDFRSWARLGRPIIREFQSPSIQTVALIIDTSMSHWSSSSRSNLSSTEPAVERVLSLAATAVSDLTLKLVRVCLYVTSESPSSLAEFGHTRSHLDSETLLIRLAAAEHVTPEDADQRIAKVISELGGSPGLIVTARRDPAWRKKLPKNVVVLCTSREDLPHTEADRAGPREGKVQAAHDPNRPTAPQAVV